MKSIFLVILLVLPLNFIGGGKSLADDKSQTVERARGVVALKLHLMAADLLDELIFRWSQNPPLGVPSKVVLMNIQNPMGLNAEFSTFLENHLFQLLIHNPSSFIIPTHCDSCNVLTAYSNADQTVITRGAKIPHIMTAENNAIYALYLDFNLERQNLVLRSRLVSLAEEGKIVHAESLTTNSSNPPSLRNPEKLVSVASQREEYENILRRSERARMSMGMKLTLFNFQDDTIIMPPLPWFLVGIDVFPSENRDWYMNLSLGFTSIPGEANGNSFETRYGSRISPTRSNLVQPEVFWNLALGYFEVKGNAARTLTAAGRQTSGEFLAALNSEDHKPVFGTGTVSLGVEVQLARMSRVGLFIGQMVQVRNSEQFAENYHFYGIEMGLSL